MKSRDLQTKSMELAALHRRCFKTLPPPYSANTFYAFLKNKNYYLAEKKNKGFAIARFFSEDAEIITLAVDPKFRKNGIGTHLVETLIKITGLNGANQLILEVAENNWAAINLYKKLNFNPIDRRKNYFQSKTNSLDAIVFTRLLSSA